MPKIVDKVDSGLGKLYEGDVHLPDLPEVVK